MLNKRGKISNVQKYKKFSYIKNLALNIKNPLIILKINMMDSTTMEKRAIPFKGK